MGLASWLGFAPKAPPPPVYWHQQIDIGVMLDGLLAQPIDKLWREQPHLRTVVGFISRNIAQLGLHVFERDAEDGRTRMRGGPLVDLLRRPNAQDTTYDLVYSTVASMCLYDIAFWYVTEDTRAPSGWSIRHIPSPWIIGSVGKSAFSVEKYKVALPHSAGNWVEIPADDMIVFRGWSPADPTTGTSPVHALKAILAEQISAQVFRDQMWRNGGRVGTYLTRPADAPPWHEGGENSPRSRFIRRWQNDYAGDDARKGGGTPLLEDGMELKSVAFNPRESQYVEAAKLSLETVAQVYHVNPTMVGVLDDANYSNVREFRRMLYGDTLGPELARLEQRINADLVPRLSSPEQVYVEFNLQAKLSGSFEEQGRILQQAIGAPYMTVNEGRSLQNMPRLDGGDELIRPLNVTQPGDQDPIPAAPPDEDDETQEIEGEKHAQRNGRYRALL